MASACYLADNWALENSVEGRWSGDRCSKHIRRVSVLRVRELVKRLKVMMKLMSWVNSGRKNPPLAITFSLLLSGTAVLNWSLKALHKKFSAHSLIVTSVVTFARVQEWVFSAYKNVYRYDVKIIANTTRTTVSIAASKKVCLNLLIRKATSACSHCYQSPLSKISILEIQLHWRGGRQQCCFQRHSCHLCRLPPFLFY